MEDRSIIGTFSASTFSGKQIDFTVFNDNTIDCPTFGLNKYHKIIIKPRFEMAKIGNYIYTYDVKPIDKNYGINDLIAQYNIEKDVFNYMKSNEMIRYSTDMAYLYGFSDKNGYDIETKSEAFKRARKKGPILQKQKEGIFH